MSETSMAKTRAVVRARQWTDLAGCVRALREVHANDGYPVEGVEQAVEWLNPPGLLGAWVGELQGGVLGHVALCIPQDIDAAAAMWTQRSNEKREKLAVLGRLFVSPSARGHSLGERLVLAASDHAANRGLRTVLDVMAKDLAAIRLYDRLGWRFIGATEHEFGEGQTTPAYCYVAPAP